LFVFAGTLTILLRLLWLGGRCLSLMYFARSNPNQRNCTATVRDRAL
jgi:hypothetical protein